MSFFNLFPSLSKTVDTEAFSFLKLTVLVVSFGFCISSQAQLDTVERNFSGTSSLKDPTAAKKEILDTGASSVATDLVRELVGTDKYNKNKALIESKVIKINSRYIPYSKTSDLTQEGDQFKMNVSFKLSLNDLRAVLKNSGVLNEAESSPVVLPLVRLEDHVNGRTYSWWAQDSAAPDVMLKFEKSFKQNFMRNGFHLLTTVDGNLNGLVSNEAKGDTLSTDSVAQMVDFLKVNYLLEGTISLTPLEQNSYRIETKIQVVQAGSRKVIADLVRKFDTSAGVFERVVEKKWKESVEAMSSDLSLQLADAWQRGSLGSNTVILQHRGFLSLPDQERVKERLKAQLPQLKNIRESKISADGTTFELETSFQVVELAEKIPSLDFNGKKLTVLSNSGDTILVDLK